MKQQKQKQEILVPIRMELQTGEEKLIDYFLWDLNESRISPEQFAKQTCSDLEMSFSMEHSIVRSIQTQLSSFPKQRQGDGELETAIIEEKTFTVKIDITIAGITVRDQFEWPIILPGLRSLMTTEPEDFASKMAREIGLPHEFIQAIAFSIREQISVIIKSTMILPNPLQRMHVREQSELIHWGPLIIPASSAIALPASVMIPIGNNSSSEMKSSSDS